MKCASLAALLALLFGSSAYGQDDEAARIKGRIMEKVRMKLAEAHAKIMDRMEQAVDEELDKAERRRAAIPKDPDARAREIELRLRRLDEERKDLAAELDKLRRQETDADVKKEAREQGPRDAAEAEAMFRQALEFHEKGRYEQAIRLFKRVHYRFPETSVGVASAYNAACGYALLSRPDESLDWLERAVSYGYSDFEHLRKDPDLDSLRGLERYNKLLLDR